MIERFRSMDEQEKKQIIKDLITVIVVGTILGYFFGYMLLTVLWSFGAL